MHGIFTSVVVTSSREGGVLRIASLFKPDVGFQKQHHFNHVLDINRTIFFIVYTNLHIS